MRPEFEKGNTSSDASVVKKNHNKQRREARKKRILQEREELKRLRGKGKGKGDGKDGGRKGSGDGRSSSGSSSEAYYAWNNGNGLCGGLPPGEKCLGKIPEIIAVPFVGLLATPAEGDDGFGFDGDAENGRLW